MGTIILWCPAVSQLPKNTTPQHLRSPFSSNWGLKNCREHYVRRWKGSLSHTATSRHTGLTKWLFPESSFLPLHKVTWSDSELQTSQVYTRRMPQRATESWAFRISYPEFTVKLGPDPWEGHTLPSCFLCNCVWHVNWSPGQLCLIFSFDSKGGNQNHLYERVTDRHRKIILKTLLSALWTNKQADKTQLRFFSLLLFL